MVTDEVAAVTWLLKKRLLHCLRMPPLAVNKTEVRKLLDLGVDVPGLAFEDGETKNDADNRQKGR
ncbi:MAG: hypothetical protein IKH31_00470 [Clostridia bacterium]|nr:hypothetical protein [Clostridia bacterium]